MDYDNDGDLDLLVTGDTFDSNGYGETVLYRNNGRGTFAKIDAGFARFRSSGVEWADFDNDGFMDVLLSGYGVGGDTQLYKNIGGAGFVRVMQLTNHYYGNATWGDFNHDGFPDIAVTGDSVDYASNPYFNHIYRNHGGTNFVLEDFRLQGFYYASLQWVDYDNDGWLDLFHSGSTHERPYAGATLYKNNAGQSFTTLPFPWPYYGGVGVQWLDVDNQHGPDLLLSVHSDLSFYFFLNDGSGQFSNAYKFPIVGGFTGADYDNDGRLDLMFSGYEYDMNVPTGFRNLLRIYHNEGSNQWTLATNMVPAVLGAGTWGDYDNDGDLDMVLFGQQDTVYVARLYRNDAVKSNTPPEPPPGLKHEVKGSSALLQWDPANDAEQNGGLTYNIRVGTSPGRSDVVSPLSAPSGYRRVVRPGNAGWTTHFELTGLQIGQTYYWSVQAIDNTYAGSRFAEEQRFTATTPPTITVVSSISMIEDSGPLDLVFNVQDAETSPAGLITQAESLKPELIPQSTIYIAGVGADRTLTFTPATNATGSAGIRITVVDEDGAAAVAFVTITIAPANDPPFAASQSVQTPEDEPIALTLVANDIDSDVLSYSFTSPVHGTLIGEPPNLIYTPAPDFSGSDQFFFRVADAESFSDWATISIEVLPVNDPPMARVRVNSPFLVHLIGNTYTVLAFNKMHAPVTFSSSGSIDVEGDGLTYAWFLDANRKPFSTANRINRQIAIGAHRVTLEVSDGSAIGSADVYVNVITAAEFLRALHTNRHSFLARYRWAAEQGEK